MSLLALGSHRGDGRERDGIIPWPPAKIDCQPDAPAPIVPRENDKKTVGGGIPAAASADAPPPGTGMDFFKLDLALKYVPLLLTGTAVTVVLTLGVEIVSLLLGLVATLARLTRLRILAFPVGVYVDFFRGTPLLIQLYWVFFALPVILNRDVSSVVSAVTALCLHMGAYQAETIRAGIQAVHKGQMLAARGLGMSYGMAMRRVILPQAARKVTPELISNFVQVLKGTAIVSVLGFPELMYYANLVNSFAFRSVEVYTTAALIYFALALPISLLARRHEKALIAAET